MPEIPRLDLSRLLLSNALIYVLTLLPGLFFLTAIAIGNPALASSLTTRLQTALPFGHYPTLFVVLFLAFLIGATFITFVGAILDLPLTYACRIWFHLKPALCKHVLVPRLQRLPGVPSPTPNSPPAKPKPKWLLDLYRKAVETADPPDPTEEPAFLWWEAMAKQLLERRSGVPKDKLPAASLQPLREVLIEPTRQEVHGDSMFVALHATGWSALAASYFAPQLRTTAFYLFAFFLIANGLHHALNIARDLEDPKIGDTLRLRAVLREFPKLKTRSTPEDHPNDNTD